MRLEFDDVLHILGYTDYDYKPVDKNIDAWRFEASEIMDSDLSQGWSIESLILRHIPTNKYFAVELAYIGGVGYELEYGRSSLLELDEVEPYEVTVTKYRLKDETNQENVPIVSPETT